MKWDWGAFLTVFVALGGFAGVGTLVREWANRRKPRFEAMQAITSSAAEVVETLRGEVQRLGQKVNCLSERLDTTEDEMRTLEDFAEAATDWMLGAQDVITKNGLTFRPPPKWKRDT